MHARIRRLDLRRQHGQAQSPPSDPSMHSTHDVGVVPFLVLIWKHLMVWGPLPDKPTFLILAHPPLQVLLQVQPSPALLSEEEGAAAGWQPAASHVRGHLRERAHLPRAT